MKEITESTLAEFKFVREQMKTMGEGFDRVLMLEFVGRSIDFVMGVMYERKQVEIRGPYGKAKVDFTKENSSAHDCEG